MCVRGLDPAVSKLADAIEAEARADFQSAIEHYRHLTEAGSPLDHVGIFQALARCHEKLGDLKAAAAWRHRAGSGYRDLTDDAMDVGERNYRALVEYRNAVQDASGDEATLEPILPGYREVLKDNFSEGASGLTHEGLFAGAFFRSVGDHGSAMKYLVDTAETLSEEAADRDDASVRETAIRAYELAMDSAKEAGRPDVAQVANLRILALKDVPH